MAKPNTQLATKPAGGAVANPTEMPDFMKGMSGHGTEKIGSEHIETPRIKLLQGISPELTEYDGFTAGMWFHTILEESLGKEIPLVPVYIDTRYILWNPKESGGGILARADDGLHWNVKGAWNVKINKGSKDARWEIRDLDVVKSGLANWGTYDPDDSSSQPAATLMYNIVCGFPTLPEIGPAVVTLQRSSARAGRRFMGKLKLSAAPSFGLKYVLSSKTEQNKNGEKFLMPTFTAAGFVTNQDEFNHYKAMYENFKAMGLHVKDLEGAQDDAMPEDAGGAGTGSKDDNKY